MTIRENDTRGLTITPTALTITEGESGTYRVKLNTEPSAAVTVTVAGAADDVTVAGSPLTFTAQNYGTAQTVTVSAAEDDDAVTDAVVNLTHTVTGGDYQGVNADGVAVTIRENDTKGLTITPTALTVTEGSSGTYRVKLNTEPSAAVTVTVAGAADDVTVAGSPLTFTTANYGTEQTVTVNAAEDDDAVTDAVVNLTHTVAGGDYDGVNADGVAVTIRENDTRGLTITPTALTITEGESGTYRVKLNTEPSAAVTVTVAGAADDVTVSGSPLTFTTSNYGTEQTVTVSAAEDDDAVTDAVVNLTHTVTGGDYDGVNADGVAVTIRENDTRGLTITPTALTITEGESGTYRVKLNTEPSAAVTVTVGGAEDDVTVSGSPLTFTTANYGTEQMVTVSAAEDDDAVTDAVVNLTHTVTGGDYDGVNADGVAVTIRENDTRGLTITPTALTVTEGESGTYRVKLNTEPSAAVTVTVAGAADDVTVAGSPLTFTAANYGMEQTVTVSAAEDNDAVTDAVVNLTHTVAGGDYDGVNADGVAVTIRENDTRGLTITPTALTVTEGESGTYRVKLNTEPSAAVTVTVAGAADDVTVSGSPLTFTTANYGTEQTVTVSAAEDDDAVTDAVVNLTHTVTGGDYQGVNADGVAVTIRENDTKGLTITPTALTVTEGSSGTYRVKLNTQPSAAVTVTVAGAADDVTVSGSPLTFTTANYGTEQTVTVSAAEDDDAVTDAVVNLTHTVAGGDYQGVNADGVAVTIRENDTRGLTITPTALTITEGESGTYRVKLNTEPSAAVTVTVAGATGDVTVAGSPLTFTTSNYGTEQTVTVSAAEDDDAVTDAVVNLTHTVAGGDYDGVTGDPVAVTIRENDTRGLTITPTALTITEGESGTYRVKLNTEPSAAVTVTVAGATGDVTVAGSPLTFTTSNYGTEQTVTVSAAEDDDAVTDAVVNLTHTVAGGDYDGVTGDPVAVTIRENDTKGLTITPTALTITEGESGTYRVKLNTEPTDDVTVSVAGATGDVTVAGSPLTFTAQNYGTAQTVTVSAAADNDGEADPVVNLSNSASGGDYDGVSSAVRVTVREKDSKGITITPTSLTIEEGSSGTYKVVLDTEPTAAVTVTVGGATGDVTVTGSPLTFTAQNYGTEQTVTVSAAEDNDATDDTATLTHSASGGGYEGVSIDGVKVTVTDTTPVLQLLTNPATVKEGSAISLEVTSDKTLTGTLPVNLTLSDRDASGFDGDDIPGALTQTLNANFGKGGSRTGTVTIPTSRDAKVEDAETYTITLNEGSGYVVGSAKTAEGALNDDTGTVSLPKTLAVTEGTASSATVQVTASKALGKEVTFEVSYGGTASGASDPSNGDYDNDAVTEVTFAAGDTSKDIVIPITDDDAAESAETITVSIALKEGSTLPEGFTLGNATTTVTITDNDSRGLTITPTALTITEGGSGTYRVKLNTQPSAAVTVTVAGAEDDVTVAGSPLTFTTANYGTEQTVTVSAAEDDDAVTDAVVNLTHTLEGGDYQGVNADGVAVTIRENDTRGLTITPTALTITEGESGTYRVKLNTQPSAAVTVTVAGAADDVTVSGSPLTFTTANYSTEQMVTVSAAEDDDAVTDAVVNLTHTVTGGDYQGVNADGVAVTIRENDTKGLTITPTALTITEGGSGTYRVKLNTQPSAAVTVTVGGAADDVTVSGSPLTFTTANYSTEQMVTVSAAEDDDAVTDAVVNLTHTVTGGDYQGVNADGVAVTIRENDTKGLTIRPG